MSTSIARSESRDPLDLTSLDADSLFEALTAVEQAVPELLLCVKPVLAHLSTDAPESGERAGEGVHRYMDLLDKIQFVLRQTVYYLRETRASTSALRPPPIESIPTPFASSLPAAASGVRVGESQPDSDYGDGGEDPELGLYGSRLEAATLREMVGVLRRMNAERSEEQARGEGEGKDADAENGMSEDGHTPAPG